MSATSAKVQTATTPGSASAAAVSILTMRPCANAERTTRMWSMWGNTTSAAKRPWPVTSGPSSRRGTERPTKVMSRLGPSRHCTQRGADALRGGRKHVNGNAERRQRIVDRVDHRGRRPDGAALAQPLGLGDGRLGQRFEVMYFDGRDLARRRRHIVRQRGSEDIA